MEADPREEASLRAAMRVLALDRATAHAAEALRSAGIASLLLKGPAMSRWLYPNESQRAYDDADLLVPPTDYERAERTLAELGFRRLGLDALPVNRATYAITLRRATDGFAIDLHHSYVGIGVDDSLAWGELSKDSETISVGGAELSIPSAPARAVILALHAAKDGARTHRVLHDLHRAIQLVPERTWVDAMRLSVRLDALAAFGGGLRRLPEGAELARRLGVSDATSVDVALRERRPPPMAVGVKWLMDERGLRRRAVVVWHKLFPSREFMRAWRPIARRGPIGLAAAYAWRPLWVAWHAIPAYLAVRRAERRAGRST